MFLCGGEILIAIAIGGAGISAFFGLEGALVAVAVLVIAGGFMIQRRRPSEAESIASPDG